MKRHFPSQSPLNPKRAHYSSSDLYLVWQLIANTGFLNFTSLVPMTLSNRLCHQALRGTLVDIFPMILKYGDFCDLFDAGRWRPHKVRLLDFADNLKWLQRYWNFGTAPP